MVEESLAKATRRQNDESGVEKADNWIHVTRRAKPKGNPNNFSTISQKPQTSKGKYLFWGKHPATLAELMNIRQGSKESLRDFIGRFNKEVMSIANL